MFSTGKSNKLKNMEVNNIFNLPRVEIFQGAKMKSHILFYINSLVITHGPTSVILK